MDPLVSILIPAHNSERWIADSIKSALAQTWQNTELIIVDDGSTDRTLAVAKRFESARVRVATQPNQGAAAARNHARFLSQGDYIQWLDADDLLAADKVEKQMRAVLDSESRRTLFSGPWGMFIYHPDRAKFIETSLWSDLSPTEWLFRKMSQNLFMQTATWLVSRELTDAAGAWDTRLLGDDDGEYFCRVLLQSDGVKFCPDARVYYRRLGVNSLSYVGRSDRKVEAQWLSMKLHIKYLRGLEDSDRVRDACGTYLQNWSICFYPNRPDLAAEAQNLAGSMGRSLHEVELSWKYNWIRKLFGPKCAQQVWLTLPELKYSAFSLWDRFLYRFSTRARGV